MCSGKQKRAAIMARRHEKREQARIAALRPASALPAPPRGSVRVERSKLAPYSSYGVPHFVDRGYYVDTPFVCQACGRHEVWTAEQQKWWYETAGGYVDSMAIRCKPCRLIRRSGRAISNKNNDNNNGIKAS